MLYQLNEGNLAIPDKWKDETVNVFVAPDETGLNLVVTRVDVPTGVSAPAFYSQSMGQFADQLPEFSKIMQGELAISKEIAPYIHYHWKSPEGQMHQLAVMWVPAGSAQMLVFTFTANSNISDEQRANLLTVITGFTLAS
jgi:hypothetical protein